MTSSLTSWTSETYDLISNISPKAWSCISRTRISCDDGIAQQHHEPGAFEWGVEPGSFVTEVACVQHRGGGFHVPRPDERQ